MGSLNYKLNIISLSTFPCDDVSSTTGCLVSKGMIVCAITLNVSEFTTDFAS